METIDIGALFKHGISGALIAIIWFLLHQKNKRSGTEGKHDFLEKLGAMMEAQTRRLENYDKIILAVDDQNYPKVWSDHKLDKEVHETVVEINDKVKHA